MTNAPVKDVSSLMNFVGSSRAVTKSGMDQTENFGDVMNRASGSGAEQTSQTQSTAMNRRKSLRNKNLVCFYCNGKSEQKFDGKIRQWDCRRCDATNYLDEVSCFDHDFQLILHF